MQSSSSHTPTQSRKPWTTKEDELLTELRKNKGMDWIEVARNIDGRNPSQCAQRWKRIKGYKLRKQWTEEENKYLIELVVQYGYHWSKISTFLNQRTGKQIREHYLNQLHPDINNEPWTQKEDETIIELYKQIGGKWSSISKHLNKRSENSIKNRFYSFLRNKYLNIKNPYYVIPEKKQKLNEDENLKQQQLQDQQKQGEIMKQETQSDQQFSINQNNCKTQFVPVFQNQFFHYPIQVPYTMFVPIYLYPQQQIYGNQI